MAFDQDGYRESYLRPKSRQKPLTLHNDLFERYAITLPATDAEVIERIKAVRSFWNSQQPGTPIYKYAKLCLGDDERLKAESIGEGRSKKDMMSAAWWQAQKRAQDDAARDRVAKLGSLLKDANGAYGVVTRPYLVKYAERVSLDPTQALRAASEAGLEVVDDVALPDDPPIAQYGALEADLGIAGVSTVVELVHPDAGPFRILERFESVGNGALRLDLACVAKQVNEAGKRGTTQIWDARRSALNILRSAAEAGADLRLIVLYHLIQVATGGGMPGTASIKAELIGRGLEERDSNILAVVLADRAGSTAASGVKRANQLLQEGRLREAMALAQGLSQDGSQSKRQLLTRIAAARAHRDALLDEARRLLAVPDEIAAAARVREVGAISGEDAEEMMALVPLAPPRDLRLDVDGSTVRLHWQPNVGHTEATTYQVVRSIDRPPAAPINGTPLAAPKGTSATDGAAAVARRTFYSVFASAPGRPTSRPASADLVLVPPVLNARCELGPDRVSAHWSTHPAVHHVEAVRRDAAEVTPVPVEHSSATLAGLPEGLGVHIELTAVYTTPEGATLRSPPVVVSGTPRSAAKPLENLRVRPITGPTGVQVRMTWNPVDRSDVRLKRSDAPPGWNAGDIVTADEMAGWGHDVTGPTERSQGQVRLDASLPPGVHHVFPFSIGGTGIAVGRGVSVGVTDPVADLTATPFRGFARLAWSWPETSNLAEVSWERDDAGSDAVGLEQVTRAVYDSRGVTVPLGAAPCEVSVRALIVVNGETFASPAALLAVDAVLRSRICYSVSSSPGVGPFGGRSKRLMITAVEDTTAIRIVMVALQGQVMPSRPDDGVTVLDETMSLTRGRPRTFRAKVPNSVGRPYWVRCFIVSGDADLEDPPLTALKEG